MPALKLSLWISSVVICLLYSSALLWVPQCWGVWAPWDCSGEAGVLVQLMNLSYKSLFSYSVWHGKLVGREYSFFSQILQKS